MYNKHYSEQFASAVKSLAERDPSLLKRLEEGPRTIGQLEYQLQVNPDDREDLVHKYSDAFASDDPAVVLSAAAAFTQDRKYLAAKAKAHAACLAMLPPRYKPSR